MTNKEMQLVDSLRKKGKSYTEISQETGLARSTISSYCQKAAKNHLLSASVRGNTVHARTHEKQSVLACKVTVTYAEKTDEGSLAEALRILANVR